MRRRRSQDRAEQRVLPAVGCAARRLAFPGTAAALWFQALDTSNALEVFVEAVDLHDLPRLHLRYR